MSIFNEIYEKNLWGSSEKPNRRYYSGLGSHDGNIVVPYIEAVQDLLTEFNSKPDIVDLGCGDFFIGSSIRSFCGSYTACDIVEPLISYNKLKFKNLNVDFKKIDITRDSIPEGDILIIRQVLQHLSNEDIAKFVNSINYNYKMLLVTEHLPLEINFKPNIDKESGQNIRLDFNSGVDLTMDPFKLEFSSKKDICNIAGYGGRIVSTLYVR